MKVWRIICFECPLSISQHPHPQQEKENLRSVVTSTKWVHNFSVLGKRGDFEDSLSAYTEILKTDQVYAH